MSRPRRPDWAAVAVVASAVALRVPGLSDSFFGDEGFSLLRDSRTLVTTSEDRFRPVFFTLLYLWRRLGFHGEVGLRLLPLTFGVAQVPLALAVSRRIMSRRAGFAWASLIAASPLLVEFSQELRMYSLVTLVALLQVWTLLRLRERPTLGRWAAFVAVAVLGTYAHLHYWLFLAGALAVVVHWRRAIRLRDCVAAFGCVVVAYIPNIPNLMAFQRERGGQYFVDLASALPKLLAALAVGFEYFAVGEQGEGRPLDAYAFTHNAVWIALAAIPLAMVAASILRSLSRRPWSDSLVLAVGLFGVPVLLAAVLTFATHQYWIHPKYVIFVEPFFLLAVTEGMCGLRRSFARTGAALAYGVVCAIALSRFWRPSEFGRREDWRGAARLLEHEVDDKSVIVLLKNSYGLLSYYWPDASKHWVMLDVPAHARDAGVLVPELGRMLAGKKRVLYVRWDTIQNEQDPRDLLPKALSLVAVSEQRVQFDPRLAVAAWRLPQ